MMFLPMSYDHRLVDGAYAAQFLRDLKRHLETWPIDAYIAVSVTEIVRSAASRVARTSTTCPG